MDVWPAFERDVQRVIEMHEEACGSVARERARGPKETGRWYLRYVGFDIVLSVHGAELNFFFLIVFIT